MREDEPLDIGKIEELVKEFRLSDVYTNDLADIDTSIVARRLMEMHGFNRETIPIPQYINDIVRSYKIAEMAIALYKYRKDRGE